LRTLVATFGEGDVEKTLLAMRRLPYDRLVLIGAMDDDEPAGLAELRRLESMSGHEVVFERTSSSGFMDLVDDVSEVISRTRRPGQERDEVVMSIGGGTKLMADAALFAAFRMGVAAYHVSDRVVRLPIMRGVTARNRFTPLQTQFIETLGRPRMLKDVEETLRPQSKQSVEKIMRDLRRIGLVSAKLESGKVTVMLTDEGHEVRRALAASDGRARG
jgi:hypothetical protein